MLFSSKVYWGQVLKNTERAVKPEFLFNALKSPVNDAGSFLSKRGQRLRYGNIEKNHLIKIIRPKARLMDKEEILFMCMVFSKLA